jgi:hypothetical protein
MPHCTEFRFRAMPHSTEFIKRFICDSMLFHLVWNSSQTFSCQLRAIRQVGSRLCAVPHSGDSALCHIAQRCNTYSQISLRICNHVLKYFNLLVSDPSGIDWWKKQGSKISSDCPFKTILFVFDSSIVLTEPRIIIDVASLQALCFVYRVHYFCLFSSGDTATYGWHYEQLKRFKGTLPRDLPTFIFQQSACEGKEKGPLKQ